MLVVLHVIVALASVAFSTALFFRPSKDGLRANAALIILTLLSGTCLAVMTPSHLMQTCGLGLGYLAFVSGTMLAARRTLLARENKQD